MALVAVIEWVAAASMITAVATLVLALATFSSVRSSSRMARAAEQSLLAGLWPLLAPSRTDDPTQGVEFLDDHWIDVPGGQAVVEMTDSVIYLAMLVRNVGSGLAILDRWWLDERRDQWDPEHADPRQFHRVPRDHSVPPGDLGVWQGTLRDPKAPEFGAAANVISARRLFVVEILYGDHLGAQRTISRFAMLPRPDGTWAVTLAKHWNLDRPDPRREV